MTAITVDLMDGYTQKQLEEAFDLVKPSEHWKAEIAAIVPKDTDLELLKFSIGFYTGSVPTIEDRGEEYYVAAAGYWNTIGA